ncbi:glucosamine inositolphosphorylceramide transferase family protein [Arsenicibacter rosenii]|uniref:Glucosamine inositolphosphorylceramide transferase 1 N-terminal domain-containing protein n=1 Tax=Arsenicibacter rosenii TaxID=1750698 RepID=A0A1S2VGF2_9BACT|nr:hypothetical protein [Arsenicibacter rosenii]OIN57789.1 hypothetical protein BLX24_16950 [Arsenicibacter rosenii]
MQSEIRVGLLLDSVQVPHWQRSLVDDLLTTGMATVSVFAAQPPPSVPHSFLFNLFTRLDRAAFSRNSQPDALASMVLNAIQRYPPDALASFPLDVLLDLRRHPAPLVFPETTSGIWSVCGAAGEPWYLMGMQETSHGQPVAQVQLRMQTKPDTHPVMLAQSWSSTHPVSPHLTRNHLCWRASQLILRTLKHLHRTGPGAFLQWAGQQPVTGLPVLPAIRFLQSVGMLSRYSQAILQKIRQRARFSDQWFLLYRFEQLNPATDFPAFTRIMPPKGMQFWADPHVVFHENRWYIFLEELPEGTANAHISVMELRPDGSYTLPQRILERPYHLSYPFVFRWQGAYYMIPETMDNQTIELYRCLDFPLRWEFAGNLMTGIRAVDATLLYHDETWWLFASETDKGLKPWDELSIFYTNDLLKGPWTPHPQNPVVSDVRRGRPAGRIFQHQGYWYRPSQNSSGMYGYGLNLNRITVLTKTDYQEEIIRAVTPETAEALEGLHTFSHDHGLTVIDGFWWKPNS